MAKLGAASMALFRLAFVLGIVPFVMVFQSYYKWSTHTNYWVAQLYTSVLVSLSIILTHMTNALSLAHEVWEIGWCIEIGREIHQPNKGYFHTVLFEDDLPRRWPEHIFALIYVSAKGFIKFVGLHIVFESVFLIVMSPSCGLNSCLAVNNLNIHDKSTSMPSGYGTNEHIQGFRYQYSFSAKYNLRRA